MQGACYFKSVWLKRSLETMYSNLADGMLHVSMYHAFSLIYS